MKRGSSMKAPPPHVPRSEPIRWCRCGLPDFDHESVVDGGGRLVGKGTIQLEDGPCERFEEVPK